MAGAAGGGAVGPPWPPPASGAPPLPEKFLVANMVVRMAPCKGGAGSGPGGVGGGAGWVGRMRGLGGRMGVWYMGMGMGGRMGGAGWSLVPSGGCCPGGDTPGRVGATPPPL